jgi:hypothetical protein
LMVAMVNNSWESIDSHADQLTMNLVKETKRQPE